METMTRHPDTGTSSLPFALASTFLDRLTAQDFARLMSALDPDVRMRALLPKGPREFSGAGDVTEAFTRWFGDVEAFELVEAGIGDVGGRTLLRWRIRLRKPSVGDGWLVVEQSAYADSSAGRGIEHLDLLCSGYRHEPFSG